MNRLKLFYFIVFVDTNSDLGYRRGVEVRVLLFYRRLGFYSFVCICIENNIFEFAYF